MHCDVQKALCGTPGLWYDSHALRGAALGRCMPCYHLSCQVLHTQTTIEYTEHKTATMQLQHVPGSSALACTISSRCAGTCAAGCKFAFELPSSSTWLECCMLVYGNGLFIGALNLIAPAS